MNIRLAFLRARREELHRAQWLLGKELPCSIKLFGSPAYQGSKTILGGLTARQALPDDNMLTSRDVQMNVTVGTTP